VRVRVPVQPFIGQNVIVGVRSVGAKGRASEWSNLVTVIVKPPVAAPGDFAPVLVDKGVLLKWKAAGVTSFRVFRQTRGEPNPIQVGTATEQQFLDTTAEFGVHYQYWVEGVDGEAESELTGPLAVTPEDKFPPGIPAGLVASAGLQTIELAWERNTEPDFKGYRVYRRIGDGSLEKIAELIEAPSFSDNKIETGKRYGYAISSVDLSDNESERSQVVEIVAP
jgi:fibronectin type 3 domain-containing protein